MVYLHLTDFSYYGRSFACESQPNPRASRHLHRGKEEERACERRTPSAILQLRFGGSYPFGHELNAGALGPSGFEVVLHLNLFMFLVLLTAWMQDKYLHTRTRGILT